MYTEEDIRRAIDSLGPERRGFWRALGRLLVILGAWMVLGFFALPLMLVGFVLGGAYWALRVGFLGVLERLDKE